MLPSIVKLALSVSPVPLTSAYVKLSPASASVALSVPTVVPEAAFSATEALFTERSVGAVL